MIHSNFKCVLKQQSEALKHIFLTVFILKIPCKCTLYVMGHKIHSPHFKQRCLSEANMKVQLFKVVK